MWKDATKYNSKYSKGSTFNPNEPTSWKADADGVSIYVTKAHRLAPDEWIMHCFDLAMDTVSLGLSADQPAELAQAVAKNMAANRARNIAAALAKL